MKISSGAAIPETASARPGAPLSAQARTSASRLRAAMRPACSAAEPTPPRMPWAHRTSAAFSSRRPGAARGSAMAALPVRPVGRNMARPGDAPEPSRGLDHAADDEQHGEPRARPPAPARAAREAGPSRFSARARCRSRSPRPGSSPAARRRSAGRRSRAGWRAPCRPPASCPGRRGSASSDRAPRRPGNGR